MDPVVVTLTLIGVWARARLSRSRPAEGGSITLEMVIIAAVLSAAAIAAAAYVVTKITSHTNNIQ